MAIQEFDSNGNPVVTATIASPDQQVSNATGVIVNPATEESLSSVGSTLSSISTKTPAQGQALMAASSPVVIASNQSPVATTSTQIGEVQVTPTANTVLDRLLQIKTQLTTQVRGLFDSAGNAITSSLWGGERYLHVASLPYEAELTAEGKMFSVGVDDFSAGAAASYNGTLLLDNSAGTKTIAVWVVVCDVVTAARSARFEWRINPTVTANGTLITPTRNLAGSAIAPTCLAYSGPTITAGTGSRALGSAVGLDANSDRSHVNFTIQVPPGHKLAVLTRPSNNGTLVSCSVKYVEI